jgi:hypothetical protein
MRTLLLTALALLSGCDEVLGVSAPTGSLERVDLVKSPPLLDLLSYGCNQYATGVIGAGCTALLGPTPKTSDLAFSFDLVFDLDNPNAGIPIPLVDLLLETSVYEDTNLGAVCMSFCDPKDESCVPTTDAVGACDAKNSKQVDEPGDIVPSVDELLALSADLADGGLDNTDWRVLKGGESTEVHFGFDLQPDTMLSLSGKILEEAFNQYLETQTAQVTIPYTMNGTLFFDAPDLGRYGLGFGPFSDNWLLKLD